MLANTPRYTHVASSCLLRTTTLMTRPARHAAWLHPAPAELVLKQIILPAQKNRALECIFIRRKAIIFIDGCLLFPVLTETISACYFAGGGGDKANTEAHLAEACQGPVSPLRLSRAQQVRLGRGVSTAAKAFSSRLLQHFH